MKKPFSACPSEARNGERRRGPFSLKTHRSLLYGEGVFSKKARATNPLRPKTADGILRYAEYPIEGIIDSTCGDQERTVQDILGEYVAGTKNASVPIFKNLRKVLQKTNAACTEPLALSRVEGRRSDVLILGSAPEGGELPKEWRKDILYALQHGVHIVSGMHYALAADEKFADAARKGRAKIWDARICDNVGGLPVASLQAYHVKKPIVLTVGTDAAIGKMTVTYELARAAQEAGKKAIVIPTGQTSIMIEGWGISIDALPADFMAGGVEKMIMDVYNHGLAFLDEMQGADEQRLRRTHTYVEGVAQSATQQIAKNASPVPDAIFIEGQGSLFHPAYANTCISLLHGACPTHLVLVHRPSRKHSIGSKLVPLPSLKEAIALYERSVLPPYRNAKVVAVALNTAGMSKEGAEKAKKQAEKETGLLCGDVIRDKGFVAQVVRKIFNP